MISTALAVLFTKNARIIKKSCRKIWWNKIFVVPLHSQFRNDCFHRANGVLTERLGNGLQNRVERFDSARHLHQKEKFIDLNFSFFLYDIPLFYMLHFPVCRLQRPFLHKIEENEKIVSLLFVYLK